jgi:putative Mn2+ efflux pump MntP
MTWLTIIGIGIGLAMDAFAVSLASGAILQEVRFRHAFRIALAFGLFQAIMPLLGGAVGAAIGPWIETFDHWLAFGVLAVVGGKMIYEARFIAREQKKEHNPLDLKVLLVLAVATSLDALAVGFSLSVLATDIVVAATVIGLITFAICFAGVLIGDRIGHLCEDKVEVGGGLILVAIGVKILIQHLAAGG